VASGRVHGLLLSSSSGVLAAALFCLTATALEAARRL